MFPLLSTWMTPKQMSTHCGMKIGQWLGNGKLPLLPGLAILRNEAPRRHLHPPRGSPALTLSSHTSLIQHHLSRCHHYHQCYRSHCRTVVCLCTPVVLVFFPRPENPACSVLKTHETNIGKHSGRGADAGGRRFSLSNSWGCCRRTLRRYEKADLYRLSANSLLWRKAV